MIIERATVFRVEMPLLAPFRVSFGDLDSVETILVKLEANECDGWGEAAPFALPLYSSEWAPGVFLVLRDVFLPAVVGVNVCSADQLQDLLAAYKGNNFARAALEGAWWSLEAQRTGNSLSSLLGAKRREVEVGADYGVLDSLEQLIAEIDRDVASGCRRVKLKFRPGWDVEMVRSVRREFPGLVIHIDCNSAYSLGDLDIFREVDTLDLAMIEQPLGHDDLVDHAALQDALGTPICLDESIGNLHQAEKAIELGSCRWVNIKPQRVGGLSHAVRIHDLCRQAGIGCWVGGMLESTVGASSCVALAALEGFNYPADIFPTSRFYARDLGQPELVFQQRRDGWFVTVDDILRFPVAELLEEWMAECAIVVPHAKGRG